MSKSSGRIILGSSRRHEGPPFIGGAVNDKQKKEMRSALVEVGVGCEDTLSAAECLKKTLNKLPFFKEVTSVPGKRGTYDFLMNGKTFRGDLKFLYAR